MIRTKADLLEYIQEDMRMQPRSSFFCEALFGYKWGSGPLEKMFKEM